MSAKWDAVPQLPKAHYSVDFAWKNIERSLASFADGVELRLDPDYQRGHVWTEDQQRAYLEYVLMGGEVGRVLTWNSLDWPQALTPIELVDGKQRLTAVRRFVGMRFARGDRLGLDQVFSFRVCSLNRKDVLRLYLNINAGGTPHTTEEIARVRQLLADHRGVPQA